LVNGDENTHPKERLKRLLEEQSRPYRPKLDGATILQTMGIPTIRAACRHFDDWMSRLETLGGTAQ
jgi:hypothetical protein